MSSKKGGGRQYSGAAPNMRGSGRSTNAGKKKSFGKGRDAPSGGKGRVRPARAQNAFGLDDDDFDRAAGQSQRYDPDASKSREYQLPENFEDEDLDSDEEGIFDEADEEKYGDVFAKKKPAPAKGKGKATKGKASHASTEDEEDVSMDDVDAEEEEEDLDGFEGAETMDLSDMIGMQDTSYGDEKSKTGKSAPPTKSTPAKLTKAQLRMLQDADDDDEEEAVDMDAGEDEEGDAEADDGDAGEGQEDEDQMEFSESDIEDEDDAGGDAHKSLLNFVQGLKGSTDDGTPTSKVDARLAKIAAKKAASSRRGVEEKTEAFEEDEFHIPRAAASTSSSSLTGGLKLGDLLKKLPGANKKNAAATADGTPEAQSASLAGLKKKFTILQNSHTQTLLEPLPEIRQEELTRIASYKATKEDIKKWNPLINHNRDQASLSFPLNAPGRQNISTAELTTKFKPSEESNLEKDLKEIMNSYGLKETQLSKTEKNELEQKNWTEEEIQKREDNLSKMKALLFYQELKQKRINKIKSKNYRRLKKKMKEKGKLSLEEMKELDPEQYELEQKKMEQRRIEERMSLQHSNGSKWMKEQLRLNQEQKGQNLGLKESLKQHTLTAERLKQKQESFPKARDENGDEISDDSEDEDMDGMDHDEEDLEDSDNSDTDGLKAQKESISRAAIIRKKLRELEAELGGGEDENEPAEGFAVQPGTKKNSGKDTTKGERLLGLKFMQRAAERSREDTRRMIQQYQLELDQEEKREEIKQQRRKEGLPVPDDDELDELVINSTLSTDGVIDSKKDLIVGRKKLDPRTTGNTKLVTGVGEEKIQLLPNSFQTATQLSKGSSKSRVSGPIDVKVNLKKEKHSSTTTGSDSADSSAASQLLQTSMNHPGSHHTIKGKSSLPVDTPFVSKLKSEQLFPTEQFSEDENDDQDESKAQSVNARLLDLNKIRHDSRAAQQAARKALAQSGGAKGGVANKKSSTKQAPELSEEDENSEDEDLDALSGEHKSSQDESNPWAAGTTANPRKALRQQEVDTRTKKKQRVSKEKSLATKMGEGEDDEGSDDADEDIDGNLDSALLLRSKRSEFDLLANGSLTQADLVKQAFSNAEEDVLRADGQEEEDDFERMKREAMEEDLPKEEKSVIGLPGWGSWGGIGAKQHKSAGQLAKEASEKASRDAKRLAALAARKDAKLKHVLINEKVDQKALKYQVATLPYPFTSQEAYEKSLMTPVGKEWNTTVSFQAKVKPAIITRAGEIIDPIKFNPKFGSQTKKKADEVVAEKKQPTRISGGGAAAGSKRKR